MLTTRCEKKFLDGSRLNLSLNICYTVPPSYSISSCKEGIFWDSLQTVHYLVRFQQVPLLSPLFQRCQFTVL